MNYNQSDNQPREFGLPLNEVSDPDYLRAAVKDLWILLDDIDTASDMLKPSNEAGYRRFYNYAMKKAEARTRYIESDGYGLFESCPNGKCEIEKKGGRHESHR